MDKPEFVYVTYIRSSRERVWQALTDGTITEKYWFGHRIEGEWRVGGALKFYDAKGVLVHDDKVLVCDPPAHLSYGWRSLRPQHANDGTSRATFTLEQVGEQVKLTLVHDQFEPGSKMLESVSGGWPLVLSSLKSLLETDATLDGITPACAA